MTEPMDVGDRLASVVDFVLVSAGVERILDSQLSDWPRGAKAYEDAYSFIGMWSFDSFERLETGWIEAQERVVDLVSSNVTFMDARAWDGYLLLLTPAPVPAAKRANLADIRANTRRLRKIVLTGDDVHLAADDAQLAASVRRGLAPLMAFSLQSVPKAADPLEGLPRRLLADGVREVETRTALEAHRRGKPMIEAIHQFLVDQNGAGDQLENPSAKDQGSAI